MIKNIIFDIGRVLLDFKPENYLIEKYKDEVLAEKLYSNIFKSNEWIELDRGSITNEEAIEIFIQREIDHRIYITEVMKDWHNILTPIEGTVELLYKLKNTGYKIILLSNFHLKAFELVYEKYSFFKLADEAVISSKIKLLKPSKEIYEHMLNSLLIKPEESLFIDDTLENVKGAEKLGIKSIQFESPNQLEKTLKKLNLI